MNTNIRSHLYPGAYYAIRRATDPFGPEIVLDGSLNADTPGVDGLVIRSDQNRVLGLNIQQFPANGVLIEAGEDNWVAGNYLGRSRPVSFR
jgi:hypothetical protein